MLRRVESYADTTAFDRLRLRLRTHPDRALRLTPTLDRVLDALYRYSGPGSGRRDDCPTQAQISEKAGVPLRTVQRALAALRRLLLIGWHQRKGVHHRLSSNRYWINVADHDDDLGRLDRPEPRIQSPNDSPKTPPVDNSIEESEPASPPALSLLRRFGAATSLVSIPSLTRSAFAAARDEIAAARAPDMIAAMRRERLERLRGGLR